MLFYQINNNKHNVDELCFGVANGRVLNLANIRMSEETFPFETDL